MLLSQSLLSFFFLFFENRVKVFLIETIPNPFENTNVTQFFKVKKILVFHIWSRICSLLFLLICQLHLAITVKPFFDSLFNSSKRLFGKKYFCQLILLFSLFLLLFMGPIVLFGTIHRSHCIISANFYLYLQYFQ